MVGVAGLGIGWDLLPKITLTAWLTGCVWGTLDPTDRLRRRIGPRHRGFRTFLPGLVPRDKPSILETFENRAAGPVGFDAQEVGRDHGERTWLRFFDLSFCTLRVKGRRGSGGRGIIRKADALTTNFLSGEGWG